MIITIARHCGSGGHEIGKELASRLGLELYNRKKLEEEPKKLGKLDISDAADMIINYINAKKYPNKSTCRPNHTVKIRHKFPKQNLCLIYIVLIRWTSQIYNATPSIFQNIFHLSFFCFHTHFFIEFFR